MEIEDIFWDEQQIEVYFFLDTSGSCAHLKERFFTAAASIPPNKFKIRLFCFDTKVYDVSLEEGKLYGFGGTAFDIIEEKIQEVMKAEKVPYPRAVFVISDGMGNTVKPQKPVVWYWFLTERYTQYIPKESHIFDLRDFE